MNTKLDPIKTAITLGLSPIDLYIDDSIPEDAELTWAGGGATWNKDSLPDHPFMQGLQKQRVENGTHNFLKSITVVDKDGKILIISRDEYDKDVYVGLTSKEGFIRRNKLESERKLPPSMKGKDFSKTKVAAKGNERTDEQQLAAKKHSEWMKENAIIPTVKGSKLSEEHKLALKGPRPNARKPKEKVKCPYCNKYGGKPALKRWHFENCKSK